MMSQNLTIFDLDNTLIKGDSSTMWSRFLAGFWRPTGPAPPPGIVSDQVMTVGSFRPVRSRMPARLLAI